MVDTQARVVAGYASRGAGMGCGEGALSSVTTSGPVHAKHEQRAAKLRATARHGTSVSASPPTHRVATPQSRDTGTHGGVLLPPPLTCLLRGCASTRPRRG